MVLARLLGSGMLRSSWRQAGTQATKEPVKARIRFWTWSDAVWHYNDGAAAVYRACETVDWGTQ